MRLKKLAPLLLALLLASCATTAKKPDADFSSSVLEKYLKANPYHRALKLSGSAMLREGGKGSVRSKAAIIVQRPQNLRATFFDPLGSAWFLAVANRKKIAVIIPSAGIREVREAKSETPFKISGTTIFPEDFIRFIHPGLDKEWLAKGEISFTSSGLKLKLPDSAYNLSFDRDGKLTSAHISRKGTLLIVSYLYSNGGNITVKVGNNLKFVFKSVSERHELKGVSFEIPR